MSNKVHEWVRYVENSPEGYHWNGLLAVLENHGEPMLREVLKELKIVTAVDLLKYIQKGGA